MNTPHVQVYGDIGKCSCPACALPPPPACSCRAAAAGGRGSRPGHAAATAMARPSLPCRLGSPLLSFCPQPAGTSPLYTFATVFPNGGPDDVNILLGTMSTIFW